ncbi:type II 3-dehydroquinate dehydratase [Marinivivus vitaminiproducens]|uniref:type II 3-dehydroquinate dehydratase n=1 Tax=Marinivivus vitaminiproducens TaxID=3035935 RepID=UPI0027A7116D|nr:type II 3-dehydroquinate dehydratase [Geminicoccaceae bacterium SCSIO 64248]
MTELRVLVLNGPNLNLLGIRQPEIYGRTTLADIDRLCADEGARLGLSVTCRQSNHEGEMVEAIHAARETTDGLMINAAAYSHSSIAILDALNAYEKPVVEVHLSNIHKREGFRHTSHPSARAEAVICGLGPEGYRVGLHGLLWLMRGRPAPPAA